VTNKMAVRSARLVVLALHVIGGLALPTGEESVALAPAADGEIKDKLMREKREKIEHAQAKRTVTAYIAFGKAGSSTMRDMLSIVQPFCHGLGGRTHKHIINHSPPEICGKAKGGVVETKYGYCEALQAARPEQACNYMTVLREPVERVISEWNYFCLSCEEMGRSCENVPVLYRHRAVQKPSWLRNVIKRNNDLPKDKDGVPVGVLAQVCPYFSVVDFARNRGNEVTYELGAAWRCQAPGCLSHEKGPGKYFRNDSNAASDQDMPDEVLEEAIRVIEHPEMLAIPLEKLQTPAGLNALGEKLGTNFSRFANVHDNSGGSHKKPTAEELKTLNVLFAKDIALYKKALAKFEHLYSDV